MEYLLINVCVRLGLNNILHYWQQSWRYGKGDQLYWAYQQTPIPFSNQIWSQVGKKGGLRKIDFPTGSKAKDPDQTINCADHSAQYKPSLESKVALKLENIKFSQGFIKRCGNVCQNSSFFKFAGWFWRSVWIQIPLWFGVTPT